MLSDMSDWFKTLHLRFIGFLDVTHAHVDFPWDATYACNRDQILS